MNLTVGDELREYLDLYPHFALAKTEALDSEITNPNNKPNPSQFQPQTLLPHHIEFGGKKMRPKLRLPDSANKNTDGQLTLHVK